MNVSCLHRGDWLIVCYSQLGNQFATFHGVMPTGEVSIRRWMPSVRRFSGVIRIKPSEVLHRLSGPPAEFQPRQKDAVS